MSAHRSSSAARSARRSAMWDAAAAGARGPHAWSRSSIPGTAARPSAEAAYGRRSRRARARAAGRAGASVLVLRPLARRRGRHVARARRARARRAARPRLHLGALRRAGAVARARGDGARATGSRAIVDAVLGRWFTPAFARRSRGVSRRSSSSTDARGLRRAAARRSPRWDVRDELAAIAAPTLVVAGARGPVDPAGRRSRRSRTASRARASSVIPAPRTSPTSSSPTRSTDVLRGAACMSDDDAGMRVRREVLGDEHVDRAVERTTEFTADFQDLITRYAWGEIWARPGLDRRTRSCDHAHRARSRSATATSSRCTSAPRCRNGLTDDEIKEVLLQTAIYCGVPAANRAFAVAAAGARGGGPLRRARRSAIVGAGPAGLTLAQLLALRGDRVGRARGPEPRVRRAADPRRRARAGDGRPARGAGVGERLQREGIVHHGIELQFAGERHRPAAERARPAGGRSSIYGQTEVVKDLIAARLESGAAAALRGRRRRRPRARQRRARASRFRHDGGEQRARLRRDRRLRRLPRRLPAAHPGRRADGVRARVPVRLARHPRRGRRRRPTSSSTRTTSAASRCSACARPSSAALYLQCRPDEDLGELAGRADLGGAAGAHRRSTAGRSTRGRSSRRASPGCAASSSSRCSTAASTSPATRRTSSRRPARRASTSRSPTCRVLAEALVAWYASGERAALDALLRDVPAARLARRALLVVDDVDAAPARRRRSVRPAAAALAAALRDDVARPPRARWPRTTSGSCPADSGSSSGSRSGPAARSDRARRTRRRSRRRPFA